MTSATDIPSPDALPPGGSLRRTPLHALHRELGARLVPFAGYEMPVHYPAGILAEHRQTRIAAGLFDVSHMGQVRLSGPDVVRALERLVPGDIAALAPGRMRYTQFTNAKGGILDDLMVTMGEDHLFLVVNAACKEQDLARLEAGLRDCRIEPLETRALLALQGPAALSVLSRLAPAAARLGFMSGASMNVAGAPAFVTRSGYTGEDGFEISVADAAAEAVARRLLAEPEVAPIGLGARDSLRLEAGLCLYGHDIDEQTTPIEAGLAWSISKRRRAEGGFPGADILRHQLETGVSRRRVGIRLDGRLPAREHCAIAGVNGEGLGEVTSGGFSPGLGTAIAMGYVAAAASAAGTELRLAVRDKALPARVVALPFVPHRYATA